MTELIRELRQSSPVLAAKLAKGVVTKLQQDDGLLSSAEGAAVATNLLSMANNAPVMRNPPPNGGIAPSDTPLLSPADQRALLNQILGESLAYELTPGAPYTPESNSVKTILGSLKSMPEQVRSVSPAGIQAIEEKLNQLNNQTNPRNKYQEIINNNTNNIETALDAVALAPPDMRDSLYQQIAQRLAGNNGDTARARDIVSNRIVNPQTRVNALIEIERQAIYGLTNKGRYDEAMQLIANLRLSRDRNNMIINIVNRIAMGQGTKADTAVRILSQARGMLGVAARAESQEQMNALLQVAAAYSSYDSGRGFEIVESVLDQFNDLCIAASALNGFGQQYYQDGELMMNNGNGLGYVASQLNLALGRLAVSDFERARNDADRIQRLEVRAAAYLMIAQQVVNPTGSVPGLTRGFITTVAVYPQGLRGRAVVPA